MLTHDFFNLLNDNKDIEAVALLNDAPHTPEADALRGYAMYYGIGGTPEDDERAFQIFENGVAAGDSLSQYMLGIMCEDASTPDQAEGGPRQKYDWYDAERFMTLCAENTEGAFAGMAWLWLGKYFIDSTRGEDPELGEEYLEKAAEADFDEAAEILRDRAEDRAEYYDWQDVEANGCLLRWQQRMYEMNPHDESYAYGRLFSGVPGIPENLRLALKLYEEDYEFGHSQGARALALHYEARAEDLTLAVADRAEAKVLAQAWHERADRNAENDFPPEQIIEED